MLYAGIGMVSGLQGKLCIGNLIRLVIIVEVGHRMAVVVVGRLAWAETEDQEFQSRLSADVTRFGTSWLNQQLLKCHRYSRC